MAEQEKAKFENVPGANMQEYASESSSQDPQNHDPEEHGGRGKTSVGKEKESGGKIVDGKHEIDEEEYQSALGFAFPKWKKWYLLSVIFLVQVSMNFNAGVIGNAVDPVSKWSGVSTEKSRAIQAAFLMAYGFGCEFWAPFSEEFGRWPILQISLGLVNLWSIPCALAPNFATIVVFRTFGGLSSAGGSVTLGMIADIFEADEQQWAVLFVVLSSVGGSVVGPIMGGVIQQNTHYSQGWRWIFWTQLIFGGAVQILHFFTVPETRSTVMLDKKAKKLRKENPEKYGHLYGPNELKEKRLAGAELLKIWARPFIFFLTEPIVLCLSLLSGFSDALIFTFLEAYGPIFEQWSFDYVQGGLAFLGIAVGYFIAYFTFIPDIIDQEKERKQKGSQNIRPERRLLALLFEAPLLPIGLFGFAFTSYGPMVMKGTNTWIAPIIFSTLIGIANFAIYYTTIDYMIAAYGPYAASATGGNGFARDFLAGIAAFYAGPMYGINNDSGIGKPHNLEWASVILGFVGVIVLIPIYIFYYKGEWFRKRSKYAQTLNAGREERGGRRMSSIAF